MTWQIQFASGTEFEATSASFDDGALDPGSPPRAIVQVPVDGGVMMRALTVGTAVNVLRYGETRFEGIILTPVRTLTTGGRLELSLELVDSAYWLMHGSLCDGYDFEPFTNLTDDDAYAQRVSLFSRHVNPWYFYKFREPMTTDHSSPDTVTTSGTNDAFNQRPVLDGVTRDEVFRCLIGTQHHWQLSFKDNRWFLPDTLPTGSNGRTIESWSGFRGEEPALQRHLLGEGNYQESTDDVWTIPLMNGDPRLGNMGTVNEITVELFGKANGEAAPTVNASRWGFPSSPPVTTFEAMTLSTTQNAYLGSALTKWTFTLTPSSSQQAGSVPLILLQIDLPGSDASDTQQVWHAHVGVETDSDLDFDEGDIDAYPDPEDDTFYHYVEDDYEGLSRLDALHRLVQATVTDPVTNPSPNWDAWLERVASGVDAHFVERRGSDLDYVLDESGDECVTEMVVEDFGEVVAFQVQVAGGGEGNEKISFTNRTEFSSGGLYVAANDPDDGAAYEGAARRLVTRATDVYDPAELLLRGRAFLREHMAPVPTISVGVVPSAPRYFSLGDTITVASERLGLDAVLRVIGIRRSNQGGEDNVDLVLGDRVHDAMGTLRERRVLAAKTDWFSSPKLSIGASATEKVKFAESIRGNVAFHVAEDAVVERVYLRVSSTGVEGDGGSDFDVLFYNGDSGGGGSTPLYIEDFHIAINPSLTAGVPSAAQFSAARIPGRWGSDDEPKFLQFDITHYIEPLGENRTPGTDGANRAIPGEHGAWFEPWSESSRSNNADGLAACNVEIIVKQRTLRRAEQ